MTGLSKTGSKMQDTSHFLLVLVTLLLFDWSLAQSHQRSTYIHITPPSGIQSIQGLHQKLRCDASYLGDPVDFKWLYNDQIIPDTNPRYNIDYDTNPMDTATFSILTITATRPSDSGRYSCRMKPPGRGVATTSVTILERAQLITSHDQVILQGENTTLSCKTVPDLTNFGSKIYWHKQNQFIGLRGMIDLNGDDIPDVNISPNGNLTLMNSNTVLAGTYKCRVRYRIYGRTTFVSNDINVYANVTVQTDPYVWYNSNAQFPLELRCFVRGYPYADVSWRYRGLLIRGSDVGNNVTLTTKPLDHVTMISTLTIREPGFKSFNMTRFTCAGVNKYGMDRQTTAVVNTDQVFDPFSSGGPSLSTPALALVTASCLLVVIQSVVQN
ncbi:roundabout homolog 2-like [Asterias rubens]|uniref:roundabout homolog 2-like n=1 Tax=Asterias rubens TaxID=7604 RepID=UPI00145525B8|nr:roundabout homolog 2-like [Asterias rubens]